jgi:hypothetical protein
VLFLAYLLKLRFVCVFKLSAVTDLECSFGPPRSPSIGLLTVRPPAASIRPASPIKASLFMLKDGSGLLFIAYFAPGILYADYNVCRIIHESARAQS